VARYSSIGRRQTPPLQDLAGASSKIVCRSVHLPCGKERNFAREHFWARGYAVSTVGFELEQIRKYIRDQEEADGSGDSW